ncbi:MAG: FAD-dependent monooxygenase [Sulfobacillus sp.]|nr:FAD-dependent monooxygenase [Sulfobacillus sp.]
MEKIAIVGGGIGGLTLAALLRRQGRHELSIWEQSATLAPVGAALALAPNAARILAQLDLLDEVSVAGTRITRYVYENAQGLRWHTLSLAPLKDAWQADAWCIPRSVLQQALMRRLTDVPIYLGDAVTDVGRGPSERVWLKTRQNRRGEADGIIGADGVHSTVRQALGGPPHLRSAGFYAFRGVAQGRLPDRWLGAATERWGLDRHFGFSQMGPERIYWYATWPKTDTPPSWSDVIDFFSSWGYPIRDLLQATAPTDRLCHPIVDRNPWADWGRGRIILMGDAAHAMTPNLGQGGCQAMLDAWSLNHYLQRSPIPDAFDRYRRFRHRRAARVATLSRLYGRVGHWSGMPGRIRNFVWTHIPDSWLARAPLWALGRPATEWPQSIA